MPRVLNLRTCPSHDKDSSSSQLITGGCPGGGGWGGGGLGGCPGGDGGGEPPTGPPAQNKKEYRDHLVNLKMINYLLNW